MNTYEQKYFKYLYFIFNNGLTRKHANSGYADSFSATMADLAFIKTGVESSPLLRFWQSILLMN
ncbi:hypothetical protein Hbal_1651 [Hirschia baltica ATCC 49814]|uniref:Uncharacterized protein n=1 Tax=Hirschia baltica (strain ATCC 49814 / DSM 5838 / IFAM 1418) TaxID=582402 RepID=C6XJP4_HIRBI|nr:hypothetical protein Hbal_1651 [Hirschia baltica ATCC 49814]